MDYSVNKISNKGTWFLNRLKKYINLTGETQDCSNRYQGVFFFFFFLKES